MKNFGTKLRNRLEELGITQLKLSEELQLSQSQINHFIKGHRAPSIEMMMKIEKLLKLPSGYLMYDEPLKIRDQIRIPLLKKNEVDIFLSSAILPQDVKFLEIPHQLKEQQMSKNSYAVQVEGDAMVSADNPRISLYHGDYVMVDPDIPPHHGCIVMAQSIDKDDLKIRKYVVDGNDIFLHAHDSRYPAIIFDSNVKLQGVVTATMRTLV